MESQESKMMNDFRVRAQPLILQLRDILDRCEADLNQAPSLTEYARIVDMVVQSCRTLGQAYMDPNHAIHRIGSYALICRAVALKASDLKENVALLEVCIALLQDATEVLGEMIDQIGKHTDDPIQKFLKQKLVERLQWVSYQFHERKAAHADLTEKKLSQNDIDDLLKKLGMA